MATAVTDVGDRSIDGTGPTVGGHALRTDIQALRAFAVMSVVLFHLWPNRLPGGFVGVDVFLVISGFLITGHLLREVERTGTIRLGRFWAARARRLLPASLLVLLLTAIAVLLVVPRSLKEQFLSEVIASAGYVQNWKLAGDAVDYLAADNRPSPSQHFWSLSVEEQFYVFLPLLVVVAIAVARLVRAHRTRALFVLLVLVTAGSFAYCLHLTATNPGVAYFSTFTRMWEFGLGGLASFAPPAIRGLARRRSSTYAALTLAGCAALVVALFVIDEQTAFPGFAAALPVIGTVAVVRWGGGTAVARIGELAPVAELGRISYALYLWHWPLIVIPPLVTFHDLTTTEKLVILAVALVVAWVSTRFYEEPVRFRARPRARPVLVLGAVLVAMLPVVVVAGAGRAAVRDDQAGSAAETARILNESPRCLGAAVMVPGRPDCDNPDLDGVLVPDPSEIGLDSDLRPGCWSPNGEKKLNICTIGPERGFAVHLFAVGDSHNRALIPAYAWMARTYNWRIDVAAHANCHWSTADLAQDNEQDRVGCDTWRARLADQIERGSYDAIITTSSRSGQVEPAPGVDDRVARLRGVVEAWRTQNTRGLPIIAIADNPRVARTNVQCVEKYGRSDPKRCATPRDRALSGFDATAGAVQQVDGSRRVDMTPYYCSRTSCPSVIGHVVVYRDSTHISRSYMRTMAPYVGAAVRDALGREGVT